MDSAFYSDELLGELESAGVSYTVRARTGWPTCPRTPWRGYRAYLSAVPIAHDLTRELTMRTAEPARAQTTRRSALRVFSRIATVRREMVQLAGRWIKPQGKLTLSVAANEATQQRILGALQSIERAA